jgi:hypothetical protein
MSGRDLGLLSLIGFTVWLVGAVMFRLAGHLMFEGGPVWLVATTLGVALSVCLLMKAIMDWRKLPAAQSLTAAVALGLPGLFGDVFLILNLATLTGLRPETAGPLAATIIFGNGAMLGYALWRARRAGA